MKPHQLILSLLIGIAVLSSFVESMIKNFNIFHFIAIIVVYIAYKIIKES
jgi:hypothetical protein